MGLMSLLALRILAALKTLPETDLCACSAPSEFAYALAERMAEQEKDAVPSAVDGSSDRTEQL